MKKRLLMLQLALFVMVSSTIYAQSTRLTEITFEDGESYCALSYDEKGRVTRIEMRDEGTMYEISYDPIVIKEYEDGETGEGWELDCTYSAKTDSKGRIVRLDAEARSYDWMGGTQTFSQTYTYDNDGYLIKRVQTDGDGECTRTIQYTWEDGNLVATVFTKKYLSGWEDEKGGWHDAYLTEQEKTFATYGSQPVGALPITGGLYYIFFEDVMAITGLLGKTCNNLPTRILDLGLPTEYPDEWPEEYRGDDSGWEWNLTFAYTFNDDGTLATEKVTWPDEDTGELDAEEETLVYIYEQGVNGIGEVVKNQSHNAQALYDLSGRKTAVSPNRPIRKGIYVKDGRKVVMK
ncbi:MAG: DUF4595 domain-containing protein [Bacteroidaceae bacterium]|nr:DUF4595 domain-containing protein [Bacteroidaceae bacterium]